MYPGLQVDVGNDVYKSVKPMPNAIIVNLGDMISRITNYTLRATYHRVLDIGVERFSSPFFFEPHYTAKIPVTLSNSATESDSTETLIYGDWVIEKMRMFVEWKNFQKTKASATQRKEEDL